MSPYGPPHVTFGASAHRALWIAAWQAHRGGSNIVATDDLLRALVEIRTPDLPRLPYQVPELTRPTRYAGAPSLANDGHQSRWSRFDFSREVEETLREVAWRVLRHDRRLDRGTPYWTNGLRMALHQTLVEAAEAGATRTSSAHLILGTLADPTNRAARRYPDSHQRICTLVRGKAPLGQDGAIHPELDMVIGQLRTQAIRSRRGRLAHWTLRQLIRLSRQGLLLTEVELEQRRQAVRLGHRTITVAHVLLAIIDVDERVRATGLRLPPSLTARNTAARRLAQSGLTWDLVHAYAAGTGDDAELAAPEALIGQLGNSRWGDPLYSRVVIAAQDCAKELALAHRHRDCGTTHLLAGLLVEAGDELAGLLAGAGVDPALLEEWVGDDLVNIQPAWSA